MTFSKDVSHEKDPARPAEQSTIETKDKLSTDVIAGAARHDDLQDKPERPDAVNGERRIEGKHLEPLFESNVDGEFRNRWREIQAGFVDEPRNAVERADELVAELMQKLAQSFSQQRNELEKQWDASENVSTEDLRVALTRYRSFFERLLSV
jgi:hypothetical protein